ncbi:hypothetical protein Tco_0794048 [Tanacetum coccineum]
MIQNPKTKLVEVVPFDKQADDLKRRLAKNNEAKMVIYNALPRKEYERIFMCNTAKEIWKTLLITHQGNNQVKDNKIDLLVQEYEQFVISKDESIYSNFARFNTIITSLKSLDKSYSRKNYVRKFLRALHSKWRALITAIEESKDLTSLSLDELIGNLKVHEMIIKKDSEIVKAKGERKYFAIKANKESSDVENSTSGSEDEEYALTVRDFKKFFKRRGRFMRRPKSSYWRVSKTTERQDPKSIIGGSWSDSGEEDDEKIKDENSSVVMKTHQMSGTKKTKFVKSQKDVSPGGGPLNKGGPHIVPAAPKAFMRPLVSSSGYEKSVSFQKLNLDPRPKHIMENNIKFPVASDDEVEQFYKPSLKPGVGFSKPNFRSKTPPPRRVNNSYSKSKTPQPRRNDGRQNRPHGFPVTLNNFQHQAYMPGGMVPSFPYPNQMQ